MIFGVGQSFLVRGLSRGPTSPKHLPKGWIKGRGVKNVGRHTKHGSESFKFIITVQETL
jgi:hypothetical protein